MSTEIAILSTVHVEFVEFWDNALKPSACVTSVALSSLSLSLSASSVSSCFTKEKEEMRERLRRAQSLTRRLKKEQAIKYFSTVLAKTADEMVTVVPPSPVASAREQNEHSENDQHDEEDEHQNIEHSSSQQLPAVFDFAELHEELVTEVQELCSNESSNLEKHKEAAVTEFPFLRPLLSHSNKQHHRRHDSRQASIASLTAGDYSSRFDLLQRVDGLTPAAEVGKRRGNSLCKSLQRRRRNELGDFVSFIIIVAAFATFCA